MINAVAGSGHLLPIFTIGRHREQDDRTLMSLAVQINHAAADDLHTARLLDDIQQLAADPGWG